MGGPIRQHYLSKMIQKNFLMKGETLLWWYSRSEDKYEQRTPRGISHAKHLYTIATPIQSDRYLIEAAFSVLENKAAPVFLKLRSSLDISLEERKVIADFVSYQYLRTPSKLKHIANLRESGDAAVFGDMITQLSAMEAGEFDAFLEQRRLTDGELYSELTYETVSEFARSLKYEAQTTKETSLTTMIQVAGVLSAQFFECSWSVAHASVGRSFIVSNEGVFLASDGPRHSSHYGPGSPGVATVLPFARDAALIITSTGKPTVRHIMADAANVRKLNDGLAVESAEIYSHSRSLLESTVKRNGLASTYYRIPLDEEYWNKVVVDSVPPLRNP